MNIHFEPESNRVLIHERHVRAVVDEIKPAAFDGSLPVSHHWPDYPVQLTSRDESNRPVTVTRPFSLGPRP
jgi:hypothetical protein